MEFQLSIDIFIRVTLYHNDCNTLDLIEEILSFSMFLRVHTTRYICLSSAMKTAKNLLCTEKFTYLKSVYLSSKEVRDR